MVIPHQSGGWELGWKFFISRWVTGAMTTGEGNLNHTPGTESVLCTQIPLKEKLFGWVVLEQGTGGEFASESNWVSKQPAQGVFLRFKIWKWEIVIGWSFVPASGEKIDRKRRPSSCWVQGTISPQTEWVTGNHQYPCELFMSRSDFTAQMFNFSVMAKWSLPWRL